MAFHFHPIFEAGDSLKPGQWYVVSPEGSNSSLSPCERVGACANYVKTGLGDDGKVLISAGAAPEGLCSDLHELLLTKDSHEWRKVHDGDLPSRYEHATFTLGSDLFVFAGAQAAGPLSDIWRYESAPDRWTPVKGKGSIPPPRTYHSSTSYWNKDNGSGHLLVFSGGAVGTSPVRDRKVYKFDPASGEWTTLSTSGTPPTPRQGHIVAVVDNRMFVHGGMAGQQISNDIHVLDLTKWTWSHPKLKGAASPSLAAHGCAVIGSKLYMFGGLTPAGTASDELYSLETDSLTLEKVHITGPPPPARLDHAMCTIYLTTISTTTTGGSVQHSLLTSTSIATSTDNNDLNATVSDQGAPTLSTVTIISPEGGENEDFSVVSGSKSTTTTLKEASSDKHPSGLGNLHLPPPSGVETKPNCCKQRMNETIDQAKVTESSGVYDLEKLSLSEKITQSNVDEELTVADTCRSKTETVIVPALFVFGGMDTQETVHGDSFIFVPQ